LQSLLYRRRRGEEEEEEEEEEPYLQLGTRERTGGGEGEESNSRS
jgi:hypothetical protein